MTKIPFELTIHLRADGRHEGSVVDLLFSFERVNTKENPFLFVTTPAANIPSILPAYFCDVHDALQSFTCQLAVCSGIFTDLSVRRICYVIAC